MKSEICTIEEISRCLCVLVFVLSFFLFKLGLKNKSKLTDEERMDREKERINYLNQHIKENEEFFFGSMTE